MSGTRKQAISVDAFLAELEHPHKATILALRDLIRGVDPAVGEEIKWNAPSFHTSEHFATMHLRSRDGVQVVLHLGAKSRPNAAIRKQITDSTGLLTWRAADRAIVTFADLADLKAKRPAFVNIVRQWIALVE